MAILKHLGLSWSLEPGLLKLAPRSAASPAMQVRGWGNAASFAEITINTTMTDGSGYDGPPVSLQLGKLTQSSFCNIHMVDCKSITSWRITNRDTEEVMVKAMISCIDGGERECSNNQAYMKACEQRAVAACKTAASPSDCGEEAATGCGEPPSSTHPSSTHPSSTHQPPVTTPETCSTCCLASGRSGSTQTPSC